MGSEFFVLEYEEIIKAFSSVDGKKSYALL
jgi:hypothetical protein